MSAGVSYWRPAAALRRSRAPALLAGVLLAVVSVAAEDASSAPPAVAGATAGSGSPALASVERRCRRVRVKLKRHGKVVKRNGKPVFRRVRRCRRVPSPGCRFVKVKKRKKTGRVVRRHGKLVYLKVERCRPKPGPPAPAPAPVPAPGPGSSPGTDPAPGTDPPPDSEELANRAMAIDPRVPGDINLFSSVFQPSGSEGLYPSGSPMEPASGPVLTEQQVRDQMPAFLNAWYKGDAVKVSAAMSVFDDAQTKTMVPDPDLRAAFASLKGTIWEPQLTDFLTGASFNPSRYGGLPNTVSARSALEGSKFTIIFNVQYNVEHFSRKLPLWVHEIGHQDAPNTRDEERTLHAIQSLAWGQVLHANPGFAYANTQFTRVNNSYVLRFLNSRENDSPQSEIVAPTGVGTAPGSPYNTPDFASAITQPAQTGDTPAPSSVLEVLAGLGVNDPQYGPALNDAFENLNDNWLDDKARVRISVLLQLVTVGEIAQATGLGQQQIIDTLGLQPYLDAIGG